MMRAVALAAPADPRAPVLRDALLRLGEGDGWGTTNATAAAIGALAEGWRRPLAPIVVTLARGASTPAPIAIDANSPAVRQTSDDVSALTIANTANAPVVALIETRYEPSETGAKAQPRSEGFALTRELFRIKSANVPPERLTPGDDGALHVSAGDVIEETAELVNPEDRTHVAISLPLPAGFEPLNPNLATSPAEAQPLSAPTLAPTFVSFGDDRAFYAYRSCRRAITVRLPGASADRRQFHRAAGSGGNNVQERRAGRQRGARLRDETAQVLLPQAGEGSARMRDG